MKQKHTSSSILYTKYTTQSVQKNTLLAESRKVRGKLWSFQTPQCDNRYLLLSQEAICVYIWWCCESVGSQLRTQALLIMVPALVHVPFTYRPGMNCPCAPALPSSLASNTLWQKLVTSMEVKTFFAGRYHTASDGGVLCSAKQPIEHPAAKSQPVASPAQIRPFTDSVCHSVTLENKD